MSDPFEARKAEHVRRMEGEDLERLQECVYFHGGFTPSHPRCSVSSVDWEKVHAIRDSDRLYDVLEYLHIKGILADEGSRGSYLVVAAGCDGSPFASVRYHFVDRSDAEAWQRAAFGDAHYRNYVAKSC